MRDSTDVVTRGDLADLRTDLRVGFARIDERFSRIDEKLAETNIRFARIETNLKWIMVVGGALSTAWMAVLARNLLSGM
ncbi:MAG: hypothetical protein GDA49_09290 [Rhodospirillales bacterium]|nr:hypothetical protein [Rhodospirillales bacterium]